VRAAEECDVAIVGGGPTGIVAANLLGRAGNDVIVLERAERVYDLPRAVHFDAEVMRIFQHLGLADRIAPRTFAMGGAEFVRADGERIFGTVERGAPPVDTRQGWQRHFMFYQPELEATLRAGLARFPSVSLRVAHDVEGVSQDETGVLLEVHDLARGSRSALRARYVLGCDGARSGVRRQAGIRFESLDFDQKWLVVDALVDRPDRLPRLTQQVCDPARPATLVPSVGQHYRWEFQLLPGEDPAEMERPERVHGLLACWAPAHEVRLIRAVVYEFHGLLADRWRERRVLLAGDAAHQTPPFLGQGMCQGIRDAYNLAWKLQRVLDGRARDERAVDAVLDSYELERAPNARAVVATAVAVGRLIDALSRMPAAAPGPPPAPFEPAHALSSAKAAYSGELDLPKLVGGLLDDPAPADGPVGRSVCQPRIRAGDGSARRLDDLLGDDFTVIVPARGPLADAAAARALASGLGARWLALDPRDDLDGWLAEHIARHGATIVRPDRCVYAVAADPATLAAKLARLAEQLDGVEGTGGGA
jgi:3-(3-hydroxy-phenyl)propionate hydroxylase